MSEVCRLRRAGLALALENADLFADRIALQFDFALDSVARRVEAKLPVASLRKRGLRAIKPEKRLLFHPRRVRLKRFSGGIQLQKLPETRAIIRL